MDDTKNTRKKCRYHCEYSDREYCYYKDSNCVLLKSREYDIEEDDTLFETSIIYKPHCENCGCLIEQRPEIIKHTPMISNNNILMYQHNFSAVPYRCPNCKKYFKSIVIIPPEEKEDEV